MRYKAFVFDFDFTLADTGAAIVDCANYALNKLGFPEKDGETIKRAVGLPLREMFVEYTGISDGREEQFTAYFIEKADKIMTANTLLYDDTVTVLSRLKADKRHTAIVTSKLHYRIDDALSKFGITGLVDYIVGIDDVKNPKPSPEGLLKAIEYLSVEKRHTLYIGDSLTDAKTAMAAGVDFAAVTTGTTAAREFSAYPNVKITASLTGLIRPLAKPS